MTVKRAHMVSKGYLRAWADNKERVDVLDLQEGIGTRTKIAHATIVSYAYKGNLLTRDLEHEYSVIEDAGIPALRKLRQDGESLTVTERDAVIAFLDMHLDRGRYADQARIDVPAVVVKSTGPNEDATLSLGDRLLLSQGFDDVLRLCSLGIEDWPWDVIDAANLATGDGAVLLWELTPGGGVSTITFPLSPSQLLVIGEGLPLDVPINFNMFLGRNCRRWIVGAPGTLNLKQAAVIAAERRTSAS